MLDEKLDTQSETKCDTPSQMSVETMARQVAVHLTKGTRAKKATALTGVTSPSPSGSSQSQSQGVDIQEMTPEQRLVYLTPIVHNLGDDIIKLLSIEQRQSVYRTVKQIEMRKYSRQYYADNQEKLKTAAKEKYHKNADFQTRIEGGKRLPGRPRKDDIPGSH